MSDPRLESARAALQACEGLLGSARDFLASASAEKQRLSTERMDRRQVVLYEFALGMTSVRVARSILDYVVTGGDAEARLAVLCAAEAVH